MAHPRLRVTNASGGTGTSTLPQVLDRALREGWQTPPAPPTDPAAA